MKLSSQIFIVFCLALVFSMNYAAFAKEKKHSNPPGSAGGAGAGPAWTDNPNRIDNPPGPRGGRGSDWNSVMDKPNAAVSRKAGYPNKNSNPPGSTGGPGAGPAWKDHPNKIDPSTGS